MPCRPNIRPIVGSLKLQVSFAEYRLFYRALFKRGLPSCLVVGYLMQTVIDVSCMYMIGTTSMYIIAHVSMYIVGLFAKKGMHLLRLLGYLIEKVVDFIFVYLIGLTFMNITDVFLMYVEGLLSKGGMYSWLVVGRYLIQKLITKVDSSLFHVCNTPRVDGLSYSFTCDMTHSHYSFTCDMTHSHTILLVFIISLCVFGLYFDCFYLHVRSLFRFDGLSLGFGV